jgi:hypothetical protein
MESDQPSPDIWATATGEADGLPIVYRYRMNRPNAADRSSFPHALCVLWAYDATIRNGMPPPSENELQVSFEDAITALGEGEHGYLMLVSTGNGQKRWLYYVRNPNGWVVELNRCLSGHAHYPLEIEDWWDDGWTTWQNFATSVTPPC